MMWMGEKGCRVAGSILSIWVRAWDWGQETNESLLKLLYLDPIEKPKQMLSGIQPKKAPLIFVIETISTEKRNFCIPPILWQSHTQKRSVRLQLVELYMPLTAWLLEYSEQISGDDSCHFWDTTFVPLHLHLL
jgi:hypothetical protein